MSIDKESRIVLAKIKHYLRRENKANKNQLIIIFQFIKVYANIYD